MFLQLLRTNAVIQDRDVPRRLERDLKRVIEALQPGTPAAVKTAYNELVAVVGTASARHLRGSGVAETLERFFKESTPSPKTR